MDSVDRALRLAFQYHKGQKDKGGEDYIFHVLKVALTTNRSDVLLERDDYICAALLHDIVEDTKATELDLAPFNQKVKDAVVALTKRKDESRKDYIARVNKNKIAKAVKLADLLHNMDLTRIPNVSEVDLNRLDMYCYDLSITLRG